MAETRVVITAEANQAIQEFDRLRASATNSLQQLGTQAGTQLSRTTVSAAQTAAALRQVPAQFTDIMVSLQAGQAPLTVLLQQGGQLRDMFGSASGAARALGGYVLGLINPMTLAAAAIGGIAYAYSQGSKEADAYTHAIITSGNAAGTTSHQMSDMAREVSKSVGTQSAAAEVLGAMVSSGKIAVDNLQNFSHAALEAQKAGSRSAENMVKDFIELGKSPVDASIKLNEQFHYLTASTYAQIKALQDQGKEEEAGALAQKTWADASEKRAADLISHLGSVQRAWNAAGEFAKKAWDKFLDLGREDTPNKIVEKAKAEISSLQAQLPIAKDMDRVSPRGGNVRAIQNQIDAQQKLIDGAKLLGQQEAWNAKVQADGVKLEEAGTKWKQEGIKYLSKEQQLRVELERQTNLGLEAGESDDVINKRLALVRKSYGDLNNAGLAALEAQRALDHETLAGSLANLESRHRQELVSDANYIAAKRDLQLKDLAGEAGIVQKQVDLASGKADLTEQKKYLGELAVLQQRRVNIINEAQNAIGELSTNAAKAIKAQATAWQSATIAEQQQLQDEVGLFGKSAEARAIAVAQIKIDTESRKTLDTWKASGHVFTAQEILDLNKAADARKTNIAAIMGEQQARAGAEQLRQENQKFAAEAVADEQQRAAGLLAIDADLWRQRIGLAVEGSDAQKRLQGEFDIWYANRQMTPVIDRWKAIINNLDNNFQEGFRDMLTSGRGAWDAFSKSLGNTLKTSLADALYQTFFKKYVVQIVASLAGIISGPAVAAALSGQPTGGAGTVSTNSLIGVAQAASSLYKLVSNGFEGIGDSIANGVQRALNYANAPASQAIGNSEFAQLAGTAGSYAAGLLAGKGLGSAISGQYGIGDHGSAVVNVSSIVGAVLGGPIGGAIGGAIGGLLNRAFGMGSKDVTAQGIRGTISNTGAAGENYSTWHQDGGWFRSDKGGTDTSSLAADVVNTLTSGFTDLKTVSASFAQDLHVSAAAISDYSKSFDIALTSDATKNQEAITKFFTGMGDDIATLLVPNIAQFSKVGETASVTLQRLSGDFRATNQVADILGRSAVDAFGGLGLESATARERLIDLSGGVSTLSTQATSFAQNYLTNAERLAPVSKALDAALGSLGLQTIPTTRDELKVLVQGLDLTTAAGAQQYTSLMALSDAFAQVHPQTEDMAAILDQQAALYAANGDKASAAEVLEKQHILALSDMAPALAAATRATWDAQLAEKARADALAISNGILANQALYYQALGDKVGAAQVAQDQWLAALKEMDPALRDSATAAHDAQLAEKARADALAISNGILANQALYYQALGDKVGAAQVAQDQWLAALKEMDPALRDSATAAHDAQLAEKARADALTDQNAVLDAQAALYAITGDKASAAAVLEQQHIAALTKMTPALAYATQQLWDAQASDESHKAAVAAFTSVADSLQQAANNATTAAASLRALNDQLLVGSSSPLSPEQQYAEAKRQFEVGGASADTENAFLTASKSWFGGSAGYAADFAAVLAKNTAGAKAQDAYAASVPSILAQIFGQSNIGAHANGGVASGWSLVGEEGAELVNFDQPGRVYTAAQSREMMAGGNSAATQETNQLLRKVIAQQQEVIAQLQAVVTQGGAVGLATIQGLRQVSVGVDKTARSVAVLAS